MARYDRDWNDSWTSGGRRAGRGWRAARGRPEHDREGTQSFGYGVEYRGRGYPYGEGYMPGTQGNFAEYDRGYQGGARGYSTGQREFGGFRGSSRDISRGREFRGRTARTGDYDSGMGRGFDNDIGFREQFGRTSYRRGRGTEYGADFGSMQGSRRRVWGQGSAGMAGGYETGASRSGSRQGRGSQGRGTSGRSEQHESDDFGDVPNRHYGHTPVDRWPADSHMAHENLNDDDVRESVRENLFQDSFIDPDRIDVSVSSGVVTLRGDVRDFMEARYAWDDAWESPGVRGVINNLTVRTDESSEEMNLPQTTDSHTSSRGGRGGR